MPTNTSTTRRCAWRTRATRPLEAAEVIELPDELGRRWYNCGCHGTLHHDVRAVYTKELGMWDGDPVSTLSVDSCTSIRSFSVRDLGLVSPALGGR